MINWKEIWKIHSPGFDGEFTRVPIGRGFKLLPGAGFGDLSHPTTKLILSLMEPPLVQGKVVADIGSGSGVLSIAAASLGAKAVYSFEIDPDSIIHSRNNFKLNNLQIPINETPKEPIDIVCINMISSEQKIALAQYPFLQGILLSSGLLAEEKESYLASLKHSFTPLEERRESGWLALKLISI